MRSTSTVRGQIRHMPIEFHKDKKTVFIVTLVIKIHQGLECSDLGVLLLKEMISVQSNQVWK